MLQLDKLSVKMKVDYPHLYAQKDKYFRLKNKGIAANIVLQQSFTDTEIAFLACIALEMLEEREQQGLAMGDFNFKKDTGSEERHGRY